MAFNTVSAGADAKSDDVQQILDALEGVSGSGQPISMTQLSNASSYALDVRNLDTTNSYGLRVRDSSDNVIIAAAKAAMTIGKKIIMTGLGTFTAAADMVSVAATWNAGSDTFRGILLNITNTASAAASRLFELQVGGTVKLAVDVNGLIDSVSFAPICEGRLTLTTATPVTTADVTAATTLYFAPFRGSRIALYTSSVWRLYNFAEVSADISALVADTPYDIYIYDNAGTLTLSATAWTNDTTRATALTTQNGIYVKTGAVGYRYLGTIRITSVTGQCEDSTSRRFVWNYYNRVPRLMIARDGTDSWTYTTATWRAANNNTTDGTGRVAFVVGAAEVLLKAEATATARNDVDTLAFGVGIALDATNTNHAQILGGRGQASGAYGTGASWYRTYPAVGYHYLQHTEYSSVATNTTTWFGDAGGPITTYSGMVAALEG